MLLKATERHWGLIEPGNWDKRSWKIDENGWYQYTTAFRSGSPDILEIPTVTEEGQFDAGTFRELKDLLAAEWSDEKTDVCDGTAWEFKMYENGTVVKHRKVGYVYGIEPYESIARLLYRERQD